MTLVENVMKSSGCVLIYSQFVESGLKIAEKFLQSKGLTEYKIDGGTSSAQTAEPSKLNPKLTDNPHETAVPSTNNWSFITIYGGVAQQDREKITETFNSQANIRGDVIKVLLVSKTGAEGLDLHNIRQIHIIEPYWDKSREDQVIARGVRIGSHLDLPEAERNVQPFLYISVRNDEIFSGLPDGSTAEEQTIDEMFHERALKKEILNKQFRQLLDEVSLECGFNNQDGESNCYMCRPTNEKLFSDNLMKDLKLPNPCQIAEEEEAEVQEITVNDTPYYFTKNEQAVHGYDFYEYNATLNAYVDLKPNDPIIDTLLENLDS